MAVEETQPDWSNLPTDLLEAIGKRTRDAVTGLAAFRSVCRAWRAAVGSVPCVLLPCAGPSEDALVIPLSHGWCIVVDARDASCHLSHLATGATAALPRLNAVRQSGSDDVTHLTYQHRPEFYTTIRTTWMACTDYLQFTDHFRFAVHVPSGAPQTTAAASMTVMMNHIMLAPPGTGMLCCRPGDAAWTCVNSPPPPVPAPFSPKMSIPMQRNLAFGYYDFAYHDGKMFGLDYLGQMTVFDAETLHDICIVQRPPATPNLATKMYVLQDVRQLELHPDEFNFVHLVALSSKLVLVRTGIKFSRPVAFDVFELSSTPDGLAWLKVRDAGNYELFLDGYHATFRENNGGNSGTRIYYVHDVATARCFDEERWIRPVAYCYSMQDNKLECVYIPPKDIHQCSTKPSWFVP